jgi:transitional endoplasmic reticulum ATPase
MSSQSYSNSWYDRVITRQLPSDLLDTLEQQIDAQGLKPEWLTSSEQPEWLNKFLSDFTQPEFQHLHWLRKFWIQEGFLSEPDPEWAITQLETAFQSKTAHTFILHLNVRDYVFDARYGAHRLDRYLVHRYDPESYDFLFYNRSQGFTDPENRKVGSQQNERSSTLFTRLNQLFNNLQNRNSITDDPNIALNAVERIFLSDEQQNKGIIVFEFAEKVVPAVEIANQDVNVLRQIETLQRWALNDGFSQQEHRVLLLAQNLLEVSHELRAPTSQVEQIELPFPDTRERLKYIAYLYYQAENNNHFNSRLANRRSLVFNADDFRTPVNDPQPEITQMRQFADRTAGLNRAAIRDIVLRAWNDNIPINNVLIQSRKKAYIKAESQQLLDVMETRADLEQVGGLEQIKSFIREEVIQPLSTGNQQVKRTVPTGVMFLGPPGTGKTILAEALASESGLNMVKLGNFRNMYVGQSESNLALALKIIRSMTPVLVFMDELDQSEGSRGEGNTDSGVSKRIFQQLITFMSDDTLRGQVVWIAASNRPDLIDAAMKREGRFDDKLPFLTPTIEEREHIMRVILEYKLKVPRQDITSLNLFLYAQDLYSKDFTGAELEVVLTRAIRQATRRTGATSPITDDDLEWAFQNFIPGQDISLNRYMTLLALQAINDARFIPTHPDYKQYFTYDADSGKYIKNSHKLNQDIFNLRRKDS